MGEAEPCAAPGVHAERGDVQERVSLEDLAVREQAAQGACHGGLAPGYRGGEAGAAGTR